jgi:hypothetical protein
MISVAVRVPGPAGLKVISIVQVPLDGMESLAVQVVSAADVNSLAFAPLKVRGVVASRTRLPGPEFDSVIGCDVLLPTVSGVLKVKLFVERLAVGATT